MSAGDGANSIGGTMPGVAIAASNQLTSPTARLREWPGCFVATNQRKENQMETITLYFRQGASDKIYQAAIEPAGGGYTVNFAYGRRGTTLSTGTKTQSPARTSPWGADGRVIERRWSQMKQLLITLTTGLLLAGCRPEDSNHAAAQNAAAAKAEQRAAQEREQAEARLHEQESRASHWQFAAMLAVIGAAFALLIGAAIGSRARHDAEP